MRYALLIMAILLASTAAAQPGLNITIPAVVDSTSIDISGQTTPGASIRVLVNEISKRYLPSAEADFTISNIPLSRTTNDITVIATLQGEETRKSGSTRVDTSPPDIEMNIPQFVTESALTVEGTVNEPVTLRHRTVPQDGCDGECPWNTQQAQGQFSFQVTLEPDVPTTIEVQATDEAGNIETRSNTTVADTQPPVLEETNLDRISPSYTSDVKVSGKTSEKTAITVYVNGKPDATVTTDEQGYWTADIDLQREFQTTITPTQANFETGQGWENKIKIEAVDKAGRKVVTPETTVIYAVCGYGNWFRVKIDEPVPATLTPRLMLQNIQQIGFPINITYRGTRDVVVRPGEIQLIAPTLSAEKEEDYDNKWAETAPTMLVPAGRNTWTGYQQILLNHIPAPDLTENETRRAYEIELSENREGKCLIPGFGCVKMLLQLEIPFQEKIPQAVTPGVPVQELQPFRLENRVQRTCIDLEVMIDKPIPEDLIPEGWLEQSIGLLDSGIELIDNVLEPLTTVYMYTFYACGVANIWYYLFTAMSEQWSCKYSEIATLGKFNEDIAEAGLCDFKYKKDGNPPEKEVYEACKNCQQAKTNRINFLNDVYKPICDRIFCPSAPTAQNHIKSKQNKVKKLPVTDSPELKEEFTISNSEPYIVENVVMGGSDCAAWLTENNVKPTAGRLNIPFDKMKSLLKDYKEMSVEDKKKCTEPHPANERCCAVEYMNEWGTACGVPIEGLDWFNELEESACIAANKVGENQVGSTQCNQVWNNVAGFCSADAGRNRPQPVRVGIAKPSITQQYQPYKNEIFIFVQPTKQETTKVTDYDIYLGYAKDQLAFAGQNTTGTQLTSSLNAVKLPQGELKKFFTQEQIQNYQAGNIPTGFDSKLIQYADPAESALPIYTQVVDIIGGTDQEYVVDPAASFFRSVQCACLPSTMSYLEQWRDIFAAVRNCFAQIQLTGDGTEGACQEVLSTYICDMLYEAIQCYSQSKSTKGAGGRVGGEVGGDFLGALAGAGEDVADQAMNRYGTTGMYRALFSERKIANAMCLFAFTGTWNLDIDALAMQGVEGVPIESQGLLFPCERRFLSYNPLTSPGGMVTWNYHFGAQLFAGADLNYRLELKCSDGFQCQEKDGFKNGECDCNRRPEEVTYFVPEISGSMQKGDTLGQGVDIVLQAQDAASQVRYDRAELTWEWEKDGEVKQEKASCYINQVGAEPPAFCSFDIFALSFRCRYGNVQTGVQIKSATPQYKSQDKQGSPAYEIGDRVNVTLDIRQNFPQDPAKQQSARKYLTWAIRNQNGEMIDQHTVSDFRISQYDRSQYLFAIDGDYTRNIVIDRSIINLANFRKGQAKAYVFTPWHSEGQHGLLAYQTGIEQFRATRNNKPVERAEYFLVEVQMQGTGAPTVKAYLSTPASAQPRTGTSPGGFTKQKAFTQQFTLQQCLNGCTFTTTDRDEQVAITVNLDNVPISPDERVEFRVLYPNPQTLQPDPCEEAMRDISVPWTITFEIHDSDTAGVPTDQVAVDPITGQPAQKVVPFQAACGALQPIGTPVPGAQPPQQEPAQPETEEPEPEEEQPEQELEEQEPAISSALARIVSMPPAGEQGIRVDFEITNLGETIIDVRPFDEMDFYPEVVGADMPEVTASSIDAIDDMNTNWIEIDREGREWEIKLTESGKYKISVYYIANIDPEMPLDLGNSISVDGIPVGARITSVTGMALAPPQSWSANPPTVKISDRVWQSTNKPINATFKPDSVFTKLPNKEIGWYFFPSEVNKPTYGYALPGVVGKIQDSKIAEVLPDKAFYYGRESNPQPLTLDQTTLVNGTNQQVPAKRFVIPPDARSIILVYSNVEVPLKAHMTLGLQVQQEQTYNKLIRVEESRMERAVPEAGTRPIASAYDPIPPFESPQIPLRIDSEGVGEIFVDIFPLNGHLPTKVMLGEQQLPAMTISLPTGGIYSKRVRLTGRDVYTLGIVYDSLPDKKFNFTAYITYTDAARIQNTLSMTESLNPIPENFYRQELKEWANIWEVDTSYTTGNINVAYDMGVIEKQEGKTYLEFVSNYRGIGTPDYLKGMQEITEEQAQRIFCQNKYSTPQGDLRVVMSSLNPYSKSFSNYQNTDHWKCKI